MCRHESRCPKTAHSHSASYITACEASTRGARCKGVVPCARFPQSPHSRWEQASAHLTFDVVQTRDGLKRHDPLTEGAWRGLASSQCLQSLAELETEGFG